ncbi:NADH dehydrogenase [ubiquinone] 1 subunit C2 [Homalodisca vitripennis]|uniref:NADH dehydrogenase [ubiquinone] 1 subunit C2 n=1 Tax=Homalodisca vitripennis TaxID=197043 RepID=UPI001EE9C8FE|nr:NADH dehydrogenase [ubiquinone] 1 subunit C2 [Homalodisca vitripennis]
MSKLPAVVQSAPSDPAYLFAEDNYAEPSFLGNKVPQIFGGLGGFLMAIGHNFSQRRPLFAGLPVVIGATALGLAGGVWWQDRSERYWAERDAIYRHYIELHPEDFPAKERILVGDMLKPWVPVR